MPETTRYVTAGILDAWVSHDWRAGIQVVDLADLAEIAVETENTVYEITVIDGQSREILVRGGRFFPEKTAARLAGSSLRGSFLKVGGIYVGFSMEILTGGKSVVTTPVRRVRTVA